MCGKGEKVLVHAAAGGVGIAALQILRTLEAEAIGTASASKHEAIRAQGAAHTIDYHSQDVPTEVEADHARARVGRRSRPPR